MKTKEATFELANEWGGGGKREGAGRERERERNVHVLHLLRIIGSLKQTIMD